MVTFLCVTRSSLTYSSCAEEALIMACMFSFTTYSCCLNHLCVTHTHTHTDTHTHTHTHTHNIKSCVVNSCSVFINFHLFYVQVCIINWRIVSLKYIGLLEIVLQNEWGRTKFNKGFTRTTTLESGRRPVHHGRTYILTLYLK